MLAVAYYAALPDMDVFGALGLSVFNFFCGIVEAQAFAYRRCEPIDVDTSSEAQIQDSAHVFEFRWGCYAQQPRRI